MTPELARLEAQKLLSSMARGLDPIEEDIKHKVATVTLDEVLIKYLETRKLRPNSIKSFRQILNRCLSDWLSKPITSITKDMVEARHRELTKITQQNTSGKAQANIAMERLSVLLNFAANNYEVDGQPIVLSNPVRRLSQNRLWHHIPRRQGTIPDHKLACWYQNVVALKQTSVRDYLLVMILTGLRRNEAATLQWQDIDLNARVLTILSEIAKNHREHRLPLSNFLVDLFSQRKMQSGESVFVFPGRGGRHHMVDSGHAISQIGEKIDCRFLLHDLRRTFLTMAERLDVPHYVLKKLVNHVASHDVTAGYIVVDVERMRQHMSRITDSFLSFFCATPDDQTDLADEKSLNQQDAAYACRPGWRDGLARFDIFDYNQ